MSRSDVVLTFFVLFALGACMQPADVTSAESARAETATDAEAIPTFQNVIIQAQIDSAQEISEADYPDFRFVGALGTFTPPDTFGLRCGGVLIANGWILTAAHCARNPWLNLGNRDLMGMDGVVRQVEAANRFCHSDDDIAMIRIDLSSASVPPISPVSLITNTNWETQSRPVTLAGWGDKSSSENLQGAEVRLTECALFFPSGNDTETFCTIHPTAEALDRDSGGPVMIFDQSGKPVLVGIMRSVAQNSTPQGRPNRHLRITHYHPWISRVMNGTAPPGEFNTC